jgi:hypothetical protein
LFDLVLGSFLAAALCLVAAGLFNVIWWFVREGAGQETAATRVQPNPFEFDARERWRQDRTYYAALFARDGTGPGERFRRLAKWSLISAGALSIVFIVLGVIDASRGG